MKNTNLSRKVMCQIAQKEEKRLRRNLFMSVLSVATFVSLGSGAFYDIVDTWFDNGMNEWISFTDTFWSLYYFTREELPFVVVGVVSIGGVYSVTRAAKFFSIAGRFREIQKYKI